ncbi:hypothetical protein Ddye_003052 [Dipteronia dyeriana]|uniref:Peptidase A1 domain-containing protein n=1 Tax=Dipteronia dyeriana TaxID=168575 RepID=A0AAD9XSU7_9ROSI|nr:hypothetical protein Ddye_003052 [Dipteronia dyeriana]
MASISAMMMLSVILIIISYFSFSFAISKDISFTAPLIHRSSPESPFYDPNATPLDIIKASIRTSSARAIAFSNLNSNNIHINSGSPVPRIDLIHPDYVIKYGIGSPPMDTYGVPDTGSSLTWLQCKGCTECYIQAIPMFDPTKSSTYKTVLCGSDECNKATYTQLCNGTLQEKCPYGIRYVDGSYSYGDIATETFTFPQVTTSDTSLDYYNHTNIIFGCGLKDNFMRNYAPGIVGLTNHRSSLVGQLNFSSFSYCVSANASFHGQMRFGLAAIISGPSTKIAPNQAGNYYFQNVDGLYVDGEKVEGIPDWVFKFVESSPGAGGLLIDTGSLYSVFPSVVFDPLIEKLKKYMQSQGILPMIDKTGDFKLCYDIKYLRSQALPAIEIWFTDMSESLVLSDANAWIEREGLFCLAMISINTNISILGLHQMRDLNVGIDLKLSQVSFLYNHQCPQYQ